MDYHFISDTHWFHQKIILYSNRPFSDVQDMNETMIDNWNKQVKPNDIVYHVGDFAFADSDKMKTILSRLNGSKHLIFGNHDKTLRREARDFLKYFQTMTDYKELKIGDDFVVLAHYGHRVWNRSHHGAIHLYGHSHGSLPPHGKSVDVGVDCGEVKGKGQYSSHPDDYRPVSWEEVSVYMKNRTFEKVDRHGE